jgi:hypothetical protein
MDLAKVAFVDNILPHRLPQITKTAYETRKAWNTGINRVGTRLKSTDLFTVTGHYLYAQQNSLTNVCAHVALTALL